MEPIIPQERYDSEEQHKQISSSSLEAEAAAAAEVERENENGSQENETVSMAINPPASAKNTPPGYMGKHRLNASLTQLNLQIQIIQEELDELETLGQSSLVCRDLVTVVESIPDALLPEIRGPAIVSWDRWFQGCSRARKRWI